MPFTFSHPAIVLPLAYLPKRWFSLTGLIIGSLTPDFEYFFRMTAASYYSHTWAGLLWFDVPLGIGLAFIFHQIIKKSLIENLPFFLKARATDLLALDWQTYFKHNWAVVVLSILIGAASHLLWDGFTHAHGFFVENLPILSQKILILNYSIGIYKFLQHGSTLLGGILILWSILRIPVEASVRDTFDWRYWWMIGGITVFVVVLRLLFGLSFSDYGAIIVSSISGFLLGLVLISFWVKTEN
jgi:hypothetical protein